MQSKAAMLLSILPLLYHAIAGTLGHGRRRHVCVQKEHVHSCTPPSQQACDDIFSKVSSWPIPMEGIAGLKRIHLWILLLPEQLSVSPSSLWKIWFEVC